MIHSHSQRLDVTAIEVGQNRNDVTITDNVLGTNDVGLPHLNTAIKTGAGSQVTINHNLIRGAKSNGLHIQGSGTITNNWLENNGNTSDSGTGITLEGNTGDTQRNVTITNNFIKGAKQVALDGWQFLSPKRLLITHNTLADSQIGLRLMAEVDTSSQVVAENNWFTGNSRAGVVVSRKNDTAGSQGNLVTGNRFTNNDGLLVDLIATASPQSLGDGLNKLNGNKGNVSESNRGIDRPVILYVVHNASGKTVVSGYAVDNTNIEFYIKRDNKDYLPLQSKKITTESVSVSYKNARGMDLDYQLFSYELSAVTVNDTIVGMVYDSDRNSSEFSEPYRIGIPGHIMVEVWHDLNDNGVKEANENVLDDVSIELYKAIAGERIFIAKQATKQGVVTFGNLAPGQYQVEISPAENDKLQRKGLVLGQNTPASEGSLNVVSGETKKVQFGYITHQPALHLSPDLQRKVTAGSMVNFQHRLTSTRSGDVNLNAQWQGDNQPEWPVTFKTIACEDGKDNPAVINDNRLSIEKDEPVCIMASFFVPATAPYGFSATLLITARQVQSENSANQTTHAQVTDSVTVVSSDSGNLILHKSVQKIVPGSDSAPATENKADPGDILRYTIAYTNISAKEMTDITITAYTPPFTELHALLPCASCEHGLARPGKGFTGKLTWKIKHLKAGETGTVSYDVKIQ